MTVVAGIVALLLLGYLVVALLQAGAVLMSPALAAGLQIVLVVAALALVHVPLGDYMARVFTSAKHNRVERGLYRTLRIEAVGRSAVDDLPGVGAGVQRGVDRCCCGGC